MRFKRLFLLFFLLPLNLIATGVQPHHLTAFIPKKGELNSLLSYTNYSTNRFWNEKGKKLAAHNRFRKDSYLLFTEYALGYSNSVTLNGGYARVKESLNGNSNAFEDLEIAWKHPWLQDSSSALTSQVLMVVPVGEKKRSIRYGKYGLEADLLYSKIFCWKRWAGWTDLSFGYRYYQGFPSDQLRTMIAGGVILNKYCCLIASSHLDYSLRNGKARCNLNNIAFHPHYRLLDLQVELVIKAFSCGSISIGAYRHIWGQCIGIGGGYFGGVWFIF